MTQMRTMTPAGTPIGVRIRLLAGRLAVAGILAVIAWPAATQHAALWAANHDMVDIPYVRDCHGIFRHPQECPGATATPAGRVATAR